jgi:hypothetical protein
MLRIQSYEVNNVRKIHTTQFGVHEDSCLAVAEGVGAQTDVKTNTFDAHACHAARIFCWSVASNVRMIKEDNQHMINGIFRLAHYDMQLWHSQTGMPARVVGAAAIIGQTRAVRYGCIGDAGIAKLNRQDGHVTYITKDDMHELRTKNLRTEKLHDARMEDRQKYPFLDGEAELQPVINMGMVTVEPTERLTVFTGAFRQLLQDETARRMIVRNNPDLQDYITEEREKGRFLDEMTSVMTT